MTATLTSWAATLVSVSVLTTYLLPTAAIVAAVTGYEVTMRIGNTLNPASAYRRGFHPTGVAGAFGAFLDQTAR